jgi:putative nucleotidyltransferase with HDIG domain
VQLFKTARDRAIASASAIPPLPHKATTVLRMLVTPDVSLRDVADVIATDPILTACVLKVANSAVFGRSRTVTSIREAVSRLGTMPLRRVAIAWAVFGVFDRFRTPGFWRHDRFLVHSGATAMLMSDLAEALESSDLDAAYLIGLLHDIGKLILAVKMPQEYQEAIRRQEVTRRPLTECELELLGVDHAEISGIAVEKWNLPDSVCLAIRNHHAVENALEDMASPSLTLMIAKSDEYINSLGPGLLESKFPPSGLISWPGHERATARALDSFRSSWQTSRTLFL